MQLNWEENQQKIYLTDLTIHRQLDKCLNPVSVIIHTTLESSELRWTRCPLSGAVGDLHN